MFINALQKYFGQDYNIKLAVGFFLRITKTSEQVLNRNVSNLLYHYLYYGIHQTCKNIIKLLADNSKKSN